MMKWFEEVNLTRPAVICSRVRLVRNLEEYAFPSRLNEKQADEMITRLEEGLKDLGSVDGRHYEQARLQELSDLDRRALRERRVLILPLLPVRPRPGLWYRMMSGWVSY